MSKIIDSDELLNIFFHDSFSWFHVRELARKLRLNPTTISKYVLRFEKETFLTAKRERGHLLAKANTESESFRDAKINYNIKKLKESGLFDFLEKELHYPETILLFGSYAKGENSSKSDVDIAVIGTAKKNINVSVFEKKINAPIQLFLWTKEEFLKYQKENKNLVNNILNGKIVRGYIEVFP